jgi:hypothetical protein
MQHEFAHERINQLIIDEMNSWNWYDKMLFNTYRKTGKSFRKLGDEIKIHPFSIYRTIKGCKDKLIEALGEDYEDYVNRDFELIK